MTVSCGCYRAEAIIENVRALADPGHSGHVPKLTWRQPLGLAAIVGLSLLVSACGGSSSPGVAAVGTTTSSTSVSSPGSTRQSSAIAFSRCMRSHGVPNFPDPNPRGEFPSFDLGVPKSTARAADSACRHLLPRGGTGTPQQRQQKLAFALKVARCLRTHGYPNFPDPTGSGQAVPPGIDTQSQQFQATETACEKQAQKALGLP